MAELRLDFVDELIAARQRQHGGQRGAPALAGNGARHGAAINRSCVVMLSALLQGYVEEVFENCVPVSFPELSRTPDYEGALKKLKGSGNPSPFNIREMFRRIGVPDVLSNLRWQHTTNRIILAKLDEINQIRNRIAHGINLTLDGRPYSLTLQRVEVLRNCAESFGARFENHALEMTRRSRL